MAQPKYAARFENFFLNLCLNRNRFADMAAFTLAALLTGGVPLKPAAAELQVALYARPTVFTSPPRKEGRDTVLPNLAAALRRSDTQAKTTDEQRLDLHDGRDATCLALFRAYATLLGQHAKQPARVAVFSDLSKAQVSNSRGKISKLAKVSPAT